jgi:hypothetical protein
VRKPDLTTSYGRRAFIVAVVDLISGYSTLGTLAARLPSWEDIALELGLDAHEASSFGDDWPDPPPKVLGELVAAVLRGLLADRPGLLLPYEDVAGRLSIAVADVPGVVKAVPELAYDGPFGRMQRRVWRSRLEAALRLRDGDDPIGGRLAAVLAGVASRLCVVCEDETTSRACSVCRQGVDGRHYVLSSELLTPAWSEPRIVCFACVEDGSAEDERFPAASRPLVERIRNGEGWD